MKARFFVVATASLPLAWASSSLADPVTPGYPERVLQWTVQEGERCTDLSNALYGSPRHVELVERYNSVRCTGNQPLPTGTTLVLPEKVTQMPSASLRSVAPAVRARSPGGSWEPAAPGMPLYRNHNVNTLAKARADIRFVDRTRVVLAEHTLVVIYGSAGQTRVARTDPASVQLDEGEVEAGLAALGGRPVAVAVQGGGDVSAQSRDTVVRKKAKRTTVSVYDGQARVRSGGTEVNVPERHGSSFEQSRAPSPARPLPPAASWSPDSTGGVVVALEGHARLAASWTAVNRAVAYRVEVARDPEFQDLIAREEVPSDVRAFRGEDLPPGNYHLRVRAIDDEDFLGLSTAPLSFTLLGARVHGAAPGATGPGLQVNPYSTLSFDPRADIELSLDGGGFGPVPTSIDLASSTPKRISLRTRGSSQARDYDVHYAVVNADISVTPGPKPGELRASVSLTGLQGFDIPNVVAPRLRYRAQGHSDEIPLSPSSGNPSVLTATFAAGPADSELALYVVDRRGRVLGTTTIPAEPPNAPMRHHGPKRPRPLGIDTPLLPLSTTTDVGWWTPAPAQAADAAVTAASSEEGTAGQVHLRTTGRFGDGSVEALLPMPAFGDAGSEETGGWLGGRWNLQSLSGRKLVWGPAVRVGIPLSNDGPPARLEGGFALGSEVGRFGWLANVGMRGKLESAGSRAPAPSSQGFLLAGGTYDLTPRLRSWTLLDAHLVHSAQETAGRGGLGLGMEAGSRWFGGLGVRLSPWNDAGGWLTAQLAAGVRAW